MSDATDAADQEIAYADPDAEPDFTPGELATVTDPDDDGHEEPDERESEGTES